MALQKDVEFYKLVDFCFDSYEKYHEEYNINARQYFAPFMGYNGVNGSVQVGTVLNTESYPPANPKPFNIDQLLNLLKEMEQFADPLVDEICKRHGGTFTRDTNVEGSSDNSVKDQLLQVTSVSGQLTSKFLEYMSDGNLDTNEADDLEKIAFIARQQLKVFEDYMREVKQKEEQGV